MDIGSGWPAIRWTIGSAKIIKKEEKRLNTTTNIILIFFLKFANDTGSMLYKLVALGYTELQMEIINSRPDQVILSQMEYGPIHAGLPHFANTSSISDCCNCTDRLFPTGKNYFLTWS